RPVSSFDIAQLVQAVQAQQLADQQQRVASGSLIGSLIDQALFKFTSLDSGSGSAERISSSASGRQSLLTPGRTNLLDSEPMDRGDILGLSNAAHAATSDDALELGNLSALEDERRGSHADLEPLSGPVSSSQFPVSSYVPEPMPEAGSKSGLVGFIVLLFILGALGGAYFSGALPLSVLGFAFI